MSGSTALPPIQIKIAGAQTAQQAIDGMVAAADRLGAASTGHGKAGCAAIGLRC